MRYSIAALALAGAVAAWPSHIARDVSVVNDVEVVEEVQWVTDIVTVTGAPPAAASTPASSPAAVPAANLAAAPNHAQAPASSPAPTTMVQVVTQAPAAPATPASTSTPAAAATSSSSDPNSPAAILAVVNKWRSAYGLRNLIWDNGLEDNAKKTGTDDQGTEEKHELNPGSFAQVITPGIQSCSGKNCDGFSPFELAYLAGWLCEIPTAPALHGLCPNAVKVAGMDLSSGDTGHALILISVAYTKIGCASTANGQPETAQFTILWVCDLA